MDFTLSEAKNLFFRLISIDPKILRRSAPQNDRGKPLLRMAERGKPLLRMTEEGKTAPQNDRGRKTASQNGKKGVRASWNNSFTP